MSKWISIKDELPAAGVWVLTYTQQEDINGCPCRILDISGHVKGHFPSSVTHWMPLPDAPTAKVKKKRIPSCDACDFMNALCGYGKERGSQNCKENIAGQVCF